MPAAVMNYAPASRHMAGQHQYTSSSGGSSGASVSRGYAASSMDYAQAAPPSSSQAALPSSSSQGGGYSSGPSRLGTGAPMPASNGNVYVVAPNGAQSLPPPPEESGGGRIRRPRPDTEEIKRVGRIHYQELFTFLRSHLAKGQTGPRSNAREKLTRLSKQQFTELSTDVYDELMRRLNNSRNGQEMPHLAVRDEFHPKRNQARQKLATLPKTRFKDLSSDVFFELERRFPELRDEFRPEAAAREREEQEREARAAAAADSSSTLAEEPSSSSMAAQLPTSDVIIPAKSTLVSEDIAVPYVKSATPPPGPTAAVASPPSDVDDSGPSNETGTTAARIKGRTSTYTDASRDSMGSARDPNGVDNRSTMYSQASSVGTGFFNGYAQSRGTESVASPNLGRGEGTSTFGIEKMRSDYEFRIATLQQRVGALEAQNAELKEESEEQVMRSRTQLLEVDQHRERTRGLEEELREIKERHEAVSREKERHRELHDDAHGRLEQTLAELETLRRNHHELQQQRDAKGDDNDETVAHLREEMEALQSDYAHQEELVQELRGEVTSLLDELRQLSARNDEMMAEKESDLVVVRDLNNQMQSYKRKYEAAKTELRALKATSQLFVQPPKADEFVPASEKGAIADVNLTAFQSSIDELLSAARSKTPSNVLLAMKTVVLAMTLVTEDIVKWESSGVSELSSEEREQLNMLRSKSSATLNNLMTACRNHASSHGMSPVSLLDAAASHVSATVVDFAKLLKVRKASKAETDELENTFAQGTLTNGLKPLHINAVSNASAYKEPPFSPSLNTTPVSRSSTEDRLNPNSAGDGGRFSPRTRTHTAGRYSPVGYRPDITRKNSQGEASWRDDRQRAASISSGSSQNGAASTVVPAVPIISQAIRNKALPPSRSSSNGTASPGGGNTPQSPSNQTPRTSADDSEENWAELRNYIDVQIESIVHAIQALLSAIREGATGVQLKENVEQITTIVSSIVAISKDNLPAGPRAAEGERILQALTNDCEKLSEMQSRPTFDKATKSVMASASYGMAKGLKALNALLSPLE